MNFFTLITHITRQATNNTLRTIAAILHVVMMLGVYFAMEGSFTVGMIMAFQGFLSSFLAPATKLITAGQTLQEMRTDKERVEDILKYPADPNCDTEKPFDENTSYQKLTGNIEIKHVTFGYSKLGDPLIKNFNLTLTPGKRVAFDVFL